ncbi:MAG: SMC-Scp complex subunit ScpB [Armatimonadetes bacterium]|nr:SMC-Scp complex subunit ScpB [Armatimonadota bacterium]
MTDIISAEPVSEAPVSEVADVESGVVVAQPIVETGLDRSKSEIVNALECMLFVSTGPLNTAQLAEALQVGPTEIEEAMAALETRLDSGSGLQLMRVAGGFQLCTRPEYADYCAAILQPARKKLSRAALETLAIIAYRQPCTQPEVEAVRGVSVDGVIKTLIDRGLIKEAGRKHTPGRPILYATTPEFLEYFGLNDISELPDIDALAVDEVRALEAQREMFRQTVEKNEGDGEDGETPSGQ